MNLPRTGDTIAAIATPPGRGGIAVVRVSGPATADIAHRLLGRVPALRMATRARFTDRAGAEIDDGLALRFEAPRSFTGEDVLELQGHGGVVVARMVLERVCELGARPAGPGEFTLRAFLNDRIDLAQAEAIADLIDGASTSAVPVRTGGPLTGEFLEKPSRAHRDALIELRAFHRGGHRLSGRRARSPRDAGDGGSARGVADRRPRATLAESRRGAVLRSGVKLVIAGAPNVGKSSLLNRLARTDTAIVTDVPGTTRDVVRERVVIAGIPFDVHDTAGLRKTSDPVERIGVDRATDAIDDADLVLVVVDDRDAACDADHDALLERAGAAAAHIVVRNKVDLSGAEPGVATDSEGLPTAYVSALEGNGLGELEEAIVERVMRGTTACEDAFMARRRHVGRAGTCVGAHSTGRSGRLTVDNAGELVAEELRDAPGRARHDHRRVSRPRNLLARIFLSFCIGK